VVAQLRADGATRHLPLLLLEQYISLVAEHLTNSSWRQAAIARWMRRAKVAVGDGKGEIEEATMPRAERVDILVLGCGEGGKYLAWHLA